MRIAREIPATLLVLAVAACQRAEGDAQSGTAPTVEQDRSAIDKGRAAYVAAWRAGDADLITQRYTPDAYVLYPNQPPVSGATAIHAYFKAFFDEFRQEAFDLTSEEIEVAGSWAFDRGTYRWTGIPRAGGAPVEDHGKYLVILRRQPDGSWLVARDMDNSDRPLTQQARGAS